ncbi:hypothetical protein [Nocardia blacklockiae]|uniref:hypothetical protein n=1 Tax=Nocardia blacklockiae TaxID=480036 RepID=UPI001895E6E3|nr:hypothetical protein [Nocardia blacklockiae]MBF6176045.1 hypothetical protein [Nocardia blacklockiae]
MTQIFSASPAHSGGPSRPDADAPPRQVHFQSPSTEALVVQPSGPGPRRRYRAAAARAPHLLLWSAATRTEFAVCRGDGEPVWHARFPAGLGIASDEAAAQCAALHAITVAGRARQHIEAATAALRLVVACVVGVDLDALYRAATASSVMLDVGVAGAVNPAVACCLTDHYTHWSQVDLAALIRQQRGPA